MNSLFMWLSGLFVFLDVLIMYGELFVIFNLLCMMSWDFENLWDGFFDIMVLDNILCFEEIKVFGD